MTTTPTTEHHLRVRLPNGEWVWMERDAVRKAIACPHAIRDDLRIKPQPLKGRKRPLLHGNGHDHLERFES